MSASWGITHWTAEAIYQDATLSPAQKHVALALQHHADHATGECHPSIGRLAFMTSYDARTIKRVLAQLEQRGWQRAFRRSEHHRGNLTNRYRVRPVGPQRARPTGGVIDDHQGVIDDHQGGDRRSPKIHNRKEEQISAARRSAPPPPPPPLLEISDPSLPPAARANTVVEGGRDPVDRPKLEPEVAAAVSRHWPTVAPNTAARWIGRIAELPEPRADSRELVAYLKAASVDPTLAPERAKHPLGAACTRDRFLPWLARYRMRVVRTAGPEVERPSHEPVRPAGRAAAPPPWLAELDQRRAASAAGAHERPSGRSSGHRDTENASTRR